MATLKEIRENQFITQTELSTKSGVSRDGINRIENGKQKPRFSTIIKLAKALGVEPGDIELPNP